MASIGVDGDQPDATDANAHGAPRRERRWIGTERENRDPPATVTGGQMADGYQRLFAGRHDG